MAGCLILLALPEMCASARIAGLPPALGKTEAGSGMATKTH